MKRNFGLDVLRALSIWLVLLQHGGINIPGLMPLKIGGIGVEIFFVLSGYLIGGILFREIEKGHSLRKTLQAFWVRRWFRILPLYYGALCFSFLFVDNSIGWNILYYVFFLQNNFYGISYMDVSWSLVIEEWFYLFAPFFLFFLMRKARSLKVVFGAMVAFIVLVNVLRFSYVWVGDIPYSGVNSNFPFRFDSLFLGVLLSFFNHFDWPVFQTMASRKVFLMGILLFSGYIFYYWNLSYPLQLIDQSILPRTIGFFILPFSIALTVPYIASLSCNFDGTIYGKFIYKAVTTTSILTYSIYLVHPFLYKFQFGLPYKIVCTYLVAWLVYTCFELPFLKLRDRVATSGGGIPIKEVNIPS